MANEFQDYGTRYVQARTDIDLLPDVSKGTYKDLEHLVQPQIDRRAFNPRHKAMVESRVFGASKKVLNPDRGMAENTLAVINEANKRVSAQEAEDFYNANTDAIVDDMKANHQAEYESVLYGFNPVAGNPLSAHDDLYKQVRDGISLLTRVQKGDKSALKDIATIKKAQYATDYATNPDTLDVLNKLVDADPSFAHEDLADEILNPTTGKKKQFETSVNTRDYLVQASPVDYLKGSINGVLEQHYQESRK